MCIEKGVRYVTRNGRISSVLFSGVTYALMLCDGVSYDVDMDGTARAPFSRDLDIVKKLEE